MATIKTIWFALWATENPNSTTQGHYVAAGATADAADAAVVAE